MGAEMFVSAAVRPRFRAGTGAPARELVARCATLSPCPLGEPCMFRRTKIVATVGPPCHSAEMLATLIAAGVNVLRPNFSHGSAEGHREVAARIRAAAAEQGRSVAILADLQGPKIRIARFRDGGITLRNGASFTLDASLDEDAGDERRVGLGYKDLPKDCRGGDILLLNDGLIEL